MRNRVINEYLKVKSVDLTDMSAIAVAGYYLHMYSEDPETKLVSDIVNYILPSTLGHSAKVIVDSVLRSEGRCFNVLCCK